MSRRHSDQTLDTGSLYHWVTLTVTAEMISSANCGQHHSTPLCNPPRSSLQAVRDQSARSSQPSTQACNVTGAECAQSVAHGTRV